MVTVMFSVDIFINLQLNLSINRTGTKSELVHFGMQKT